ncbi:MAG TPA: succinylglutamate desuccinylase/aspartoacylase family protein [Candidatus Limnocylindria bacterium]|nr:succinylglutamate desuccinylase/aspartoacylase family protein [Candidatus Limnocylindria bacterium]
MDIGPIPVPRASSRASGTFTFEGDPGLAKYRWPYIAINGAQAGPSVLVTAGIHAAEYTGIEAAMRLGRSLDPREVRGRIVLIPLLNRPGFYERSIYVNPEDNDNLNRLFPGDANGTWGQRFAHRLLTEIVVRFEHAIDLHAGDLIEDLTPFVIYRETADAARDATILRMVSAYGAEWAVKSAPTGERPGSLYAVAAQSGVAAMLAESGGRGLLIEEDVVRHVRGVTNILRAIGALEGEPDAVPPPTVVDSFEWLRSPAEGMFHCGVHVGQRVRVGDLVGELTDLVGKPIAPVRAPVSGVVLFVVTSPAIKKDGLLLAIGALRS